jgi:long-subunit acyl-CoA synthetase (AMP-forming)
VPGGDDAARCATTFGVRVQHGWGMTEMSPVGTIGTPKAKHAT